MNDSTEGGPAEGSARLNALIPFLPYILISVVHCTLIILGLPGRGFETKQLLMPALALAAVWSTWRLRPWPRGAMVLVLIALTASWIGDGAGLFFPGLPELPTMILFFAIAHLAYIVLFWRAPGISGVKRLPWWVLIYAVWWIATLALVGPHSGMLFVPLAVYGIVLGFTAASSPRFGRLVAFGGAFFLISDTFIALKEFMGIPPWLGDLVIMPTYTLGQGLIVFGTVTLLRASRSAVMREDRSSGRAARR